MAVVLRSAVAADFEAMCAMFRSAARAGDTLPAADNASSESLRADWMAGDRPSVVADDEGRVVGMYKWGANRGPRGDHVGTATFVVDAAHRGRGIGDRLVAHCVESCKTAGFRAIQFNFVVSTNTPALALYARHGFEIVGTLPGAFRHATLGFVDAHVLFRRLA